MVALTQQDKAAIAEAIRQAESRMAPEIALIAARASDMYYGISLTYGLLLGSLISLYLWLRHLVVSFPALLCTQLCVVLITMLLMACLSRSKFLVPPSLIKEYVSQRAAIAYLELCGHHPDIPLVVCYLSLAERRAVIVPHPQLRHVLTTDLCRELADEWRKHAAMGRGRQASIAMIERIGALLTPHFPQGDETNRVADMPVTAN